jgi:hypothetical protein
LGLELDDRILQCSDFIKDLIDLSIHLVLDFFLKRSPLRFSFVLFS